MKKDKLYLWSLLSLITVVFFIGYFSINYLIKISTEQFLAVQIESSKREAKEMASLVSLQLENGISKETIIKNVQSSIKDTEMEAGFLCMFDENGKEICHPNPNRIGKIIEPDESFVSLNNSDINPKDFLQLITNQQEAGGVRNFKNTTRKSEIIYVYPVKNSGWMMAAHANLAALDLEIEHLKTNFLLVYGTTSLLIVLISLFFIRLIGSKYERQLEAKNEKLSLDVINLSKLNSNLHSYKEKLTTNNEMHANNQRILTYKSSELVPLDANDIAYIYTENAITYIKSVSGILTNSNSSLDELFGKLDPQLFFRANRQFILSIRAIDKIIKYGNNQLKIETLPKATIDIIISKNKASEFKKWLDS